MIAFSTLSGGGIARLSGGNFWQGAATAFTVSALNHAAHSLGKDPPKENAKAEHQTALEYMKNDLLPFNEFMLDATMFLEGAKGLWGLGSAISKGVTKAGSSVAGLFAAKNSGRIVAGSLKEFKSLVQQLSKPGSQLSKIELQQFEKLTKQFGGKLRYDLNPVKGKILQPHVQVQGLGTSVESRHIWLGVVFHHVID